MQIGSTSVLVISRSIGSNRANVLGRLWYFSSKPLAFLGRLALRHFRCRGISGLGAIRKI